jgi:hypothetical protein
MKVACAAASLGVVALVASCARRVGTDPLRAAVFFGLNPLLLVWAIGGGHNDLLATVAVMGGVWLLLTRREDGAGAVLTFAAALKASAVAVLPYALLGARERRRVITGIALTALALTVVAFAVFGPNVTGFLQSNRDQQQMVARTSVPNQIGVLFGNGGITPAIRAVALVTLTAVVLWTLWRTWRGGDWISGAGWATLALIVCSAWLMPWYVVWLLPLVPLARDRRLMPATLLLCAYMVAVRTPF